MKLLRYDMSEYQEKHAVAKLIGAPPGYVGYDDSNLGGGLLISDIEKNPNCIVLFDEVEKAHPDVSNILLSLMDEGVVTSSNGKKADARNTIVILTSNLGAADNERKSIGFGDIDRTDEDDKAVRRHVRAQPKVEVPAAVAKILAEEKISIESIFQRGKLEKDETRATAPFILITHDTVESAMRAALERIEKDGHVAGRPRMIRIERL